MIMIAIIVICCLMASDLTIALVKHGENMGKFNFWVCFFDKMAKIILLYWAGLFDKLF